MDTSKLRRWWHRRSSCGADVVSLSAFADGQLDGDEHARVERHIEVCARCRAQVSDLQWVAAQLADSLAWSPPSVEERARTLERAGARIAEIRHGWTLPWAGWVGFPEGPVPVLAGGLLLLVALTDALSFGGVEEVAVTLALYLELL